MRLGLAAGPGEPRPQHDGAGGDQGEHFVQNTNKYQIVILKLFYYVDVPSLDTSFILN